MIFNLFRYFSLRYLYMNPFRSFLTFLGVALGISLFLSIYLINEATIRSFDEDIESMTGFADLTITADGMGFEEEVVDRVKVVPGVKSVIPLVINHAYLDGASDDNKQGAVVFLGVDLLKESSVRQYNETGDDIIPDPLAFMNQADSIIATKSWAKKKNLGLEDSIELLTKDGPKSFAVRGFIDDTGPSRAYDGNLVIMDIDGARYNFGREGQYDRADLILKDSAKLQEVKLKLREMLGPRFKVEDKKEQSQSMQQMVKSMQDLSYVLGLISFFVGFLIIVNTVNTAIFQRKKDIGSLRAFGAGRVHITLLFAGEFIFLALCSSCFGAFLGYQFALASLDQVTAGLNATMMTNLGNARIVFDKEHLAMALSLGFLSSSAALVYPLVKALRIHPIEAIKPASMDFGFHSRGKVWDVLAVIGSVLMIGTFTMAYFSDGVEAFQAKSLQPFLLMFGLAGVWLLSPFLSLTVLSALQKLPLPFIFRFAVSNLLKNPSKTASTSIHISLGFGLVIMVSAINLSFKSTILRWADLIANRPNVVSVSSWGNFGSLQVQPLHEDVKKKLEKLPMISQELSAPVLGTRIVGININGDKFIIRAIDDQKDLAHYGFIDAIGADPYVLGRSLYVPGGRNVLISETMVLRFKKSVGDKLTLDTPSGSQQFDITGIVRDFASPNGVIYFNRDLYRELWNDPLVTFFTVGHSPEISSQEFKELISPQLNNQEHLMVTLTSKVREDISTNLNNTMALSESTKWIALFVGMLGLLNSFLIEIIQRFRELGCIRSIGMTRPQLLGMILLESLSLGASGILVSFALVLPMTYAWVNWTLSYFLGWKVEFHFTSSDFLVLFVSGIIVALFAGLLPAFKASRLKLREALEYE